MNYSKSSGRVNFGAISACLLGGFFGVVSLGVGSAAGQENPDEFVAGEVIVGLEDGVSVSEQRGVVAVGAELGASVETAVPELGLRVLDLPAGVGVGEAIRKYEDTPGVEFAEPNYIVRPVQATSDPGFPQLWGLENTGQNNGTPDADVDAPEGWPLVQDASPVVVAVIDSGVEVNHPDLRENIWVNPGEVAGNGIDDDGNGHVDDVNGWDFANGDASVYDGLQDDHGTHVAGTIAAEPDNGLGIVGVARNTKVMPLKFIEGDGGSVSDAIAAIDYAVRMGVPVSNNSWGGAGNSLSLRLAIERAGEQDHLFVAAAGNSGANNDSPAEASYPASYDSENIISVAATDRRDRLAGFSNYGATKVDLGAPGADILSTIPGGGYASFSGTSMASPHVAGAAALILSRNPGLRDDEVKSALLSESDSISSLAGRTVTGGRLNVFSALRAVPDSQGNTSETGGGTEPDDSVPVSGVDPDEPADVTPPRIDRIKPAAGAAVKVRRPQILATVSDEDSTVPKGRIAFFVDGQKRQFTYAQSTGRITFTPPKNLSYGKHTVRVVATDEAGNQAAKNWSFRVVRAR